MARLFAWSDLHVDHRENRELLTRLSSADYLADTLLVAGDVSSDPSKLFGALEHLQARFKEIAFVPGNHDLWVNGDPARDSLQKLHELLDRCRSRGIRVAPFSVSVLGRLCRIVPLLSWYLKPEEGDGSLFCHKPGEDPTLRIWADNHRIKWPRMPGNQSPAEHLLSLNPPPAPVESGTTVVTFSHFLPRAELIFDEGPGFPAGGRPSGPDAHPEFNFTRVAGCRQLDAALRSWGATIHIHGHQHRNRDRILDGVRHVSHCLGYPDEWKALNTRPPRHLPLELIW